MSGTSHPSANRFTKQAKTAEDLLANQTVGLVNLSDFRKRRAEAIEQKERDLHEGLLGNGKGDGTLTPPSLTQASSTNTTSKPKKKRKIGTPKLSFNDDGDDPDDSSAPTSGTATPNSRTSTPKLVNTSLSVVPKALTKSALLREAQTRESLRKEFLARQESVKAVEIEIPFVFYDGMNIPGGTVRVKKGDYIWVFLDRSRKVGADMGVGKGNSNREWARVGVDDLMLVRGSLIIPHHYDFYYFILNRTLGPNNRMLFEYTSKPPTESAATTPAPPLDLDTYNPLSRPSDKPKTKPEEVEKKDLEGKDDDPTFTKVVDRRWYERNKHIFPASVWQDFDPEKDYQTEVKRDAGGNAFFFS